MPPDARLLRVFFEAPGSFYPFQELAERAQLSEQTLAERLHVLREAGYSFVQHPVLGVGLGETPERLVGDEILARIRSDSFVREVFVFAETRSTNDVVNRLGSEGASEGVVVFAEHQTGGRGRFGRKWESERGSGLWFSLLVRPSRPQAEWARLSIVVALSIADGINAATDLATGIKWPNDVEVQGKKVCGILLENKGFVTVGVGVNVNQRIFPEELAERAASLRMLSGRVMNRSVLAAAILDAFSARYRQWEEDFGALLSDYRERSVTLGSYIRLVGSSGAVHAGIAEEIDGAGRLGIRQDSGALHWFGEGEVSTQAVSF